MKIPIYQIDTFTDTQFKGNPAAVCPLEEWPDRQLLHDIAAENNLYETAFYVAKGDIFEIRWFTPEIEVDLCGHGTLAAAYVIFHYSDFDGDIIRFHSKHGELKVSRNEEMLTLDFPANVAEPVEIPGRLAEALGMKPLETRKSMDLLALFEKEEDIVIMNPDFDLLHDILMEIKCLGIIVTAPGSKTDFVSRFFAPTVGAGEDPVTGAAHTTLTPFWAEKLEKDSFHVRQLSRRGGELLCKLEGDRVFISGKAVAYMKGEIDL
ncbi:MAG: PhzF family phenazine biosynthesis protein [bacterium]|nr:PhzF family phenazine biosynthesis protein [bacterium]